MRLVIFPEAKSRRKDENAEIKVTLDAGHPSPAQSKNLKVCPNFHFSSRSSSRSREHHLAVRPRMFENRENRVQRAESVTVFKSVSGNRQ